MFLPEFDWRPVGLGAPDGEVVFLFASCHNAATVHVRARVLGPFEILVSSLNAEPSDVVFARV